MKTNELPVPLLVVTFCLIFFFSHGLIGLIVTLFFFSVLWSFDAL